MRGRFLSMLQAAWRMEETTREGGSVLLTTTSAPQNGSCAKGTYIIGPGAL